MSDSWLSIIEYARRYNVSDMTVRRRIKTGRLNAELRDGKYFIPAQEASASLANHQKLVEPPPPILAEAFESPATFEEPVKVADRHGGKTFTSEPVVDTVDDLYFEKEESSRDFDIPTVQTVHSTNFASTTFPKLEHLTDLCETMLEKLAQKEQMLTAGFQTERELFAEKIKVLEMEIKNRESANLLLKNEIEDLEILIKILESKKS